MIMFVMIILCVLTICLIDTVLDIEEMMAVIVDKNTSYKTKVCRYFVPGIGMETKWGEFK